MPLYVAGHWDRAQVVAGARCTAASTRPGCSSRWATRPTRARHPLPLRRRPGTLRPHPASPSRSAGTCNRLRITADGAVRTASSPTTSARSAASAPAAATPRWRVRCAGRCGASRPADRHRRPDVAPAVGGHAHRHRRLPPPAPARCRPSVVALMPRLLGPRPRAAPPAPPRCSHRGHGRRGARVGDGDLRARGPFHEVLATSRGAWVNGERPSSTGSSSSPTRWRCSPRLSG